MQLALNANTKVTPDATRLATALHTPTTLGTYQLLKTMRLGLCLISVSRHSQHNRRRPRAPLPQHRLRPRLCVMALQIRNVVTRTPDNPLRLGYNLLPTGDFSKTVLPHP